MVSKLHYDLPWPLLCCTLTWHHWPMQCVTSTSLLDTSTFRLLLKDSMTLPSTFSPSSSVMPKTLTLFFLLYCLLCNAYSHTVAISSFKLVWMKFVLLLNSSWTFFHFSTSSFLVCAIMRS